MIREVRFTPAGDRAFSPLAGLLEWLVGTGAAVAAGDPLCLYEIDKATAQFPSPVSGRVLRLLLAPGDRFARGDALALIGDCPDEPVPEAAGAPAAGADDFDWGEVDNREGEPEPIGPMRRNIARRMLMSKRHLPCFYLTTAVDMGRALRLRADLRKSLGRTATVNDMVVRASALALARHPEAAVVYTPAGLIRRREINIGFAAARPDGGLVVPVVRRADKMTLPEVAAETRRLTELAKGGGLRPDDCAGGVFSVSYLGAHQVDEFAAIVNPGEAAIAAVGRLVDTPVAVDGEVVIRPLTRITLSCDHRSLDGELAARLIGGLKRLLEHPEEL
ncbi:MAG: 2-oxo acid dehydrogenase subunit E2 [Planctomycetota bacterium]|jgi:pyruvate dehydrogenase E2 component (dihydrolipoamide acetyltransferase)|nr:2-oxo acid dehydrogenase subunit E2 [Planctomycetota bacterium]